MDDSNVIDLFSKKERSAPVGEASYASVEDAMIALAFCMAGYALDVQGLSHLKTLLAQDRTEERVMRLAERLMAVMREDD